MNTFLSVQEVHGVQVDQIPILQLTGTGLFMALTILEPAPLSPQKTSRTISVLSRFTHYIIKPIAMFLQRNGNFNEIPFAISGPSGLCDSRTRVDQEVKRA